MINMPAYEITLIFLILNFLLQSKDSFIFKHNHTVYTHTCVYAHISVWVCTRVHVIAHACRWTLHSPDPKEMWIDSLFHYLCLFIYYI